MKKEYKEILAGLLAGIICFLISWSMTYVFEEQTQELRKGLSFMVSFVFGTLSIAIPFISIVKNID